MNGGADRKISRCGWSNWWSVTGWSRKICGQMGWSMDESVMPTRLQQLLEAAVATYLAEQDDPSMVSGWMFYADVVLADGGTTWMFSTAPDQEVKTTAGQADWVRGICRWEQWKYLDSLSDG
jgi:hypothetical protein